MSALVRPREGRMIGGVCAALAQRFGTSATTMRILFVVSCLLPGPQFLVYLALWAIFPSETPSQPPSEKRDAAAW